jgi:hypothetical protein
MFNANHTYFEFTPPHGVTFVNWGVGFRIQFERERHEEIVEWLSAMVEHFRGQNEIPQPSVDATAELEEMEFAGQKILVPANARRAAPPPPVSVPKPMSGYNPGGGGVHVPQAQTDQASMRPAVMHTPPKAPVPHVPFTAPQPAPPAPAPIMPFPPKGTIPELPAPMMAPGVHAESPLPFPPSGHPMRTNADSQKPAAVNPVNKPHVVASEEALAKAMAMAEKTHPAKGRKPQNELFDITKMSLEERQAVWKEAMASTNVDFIDDVANQLEPIAPKAAHALLTRLAVLKNNTTEMPIEDTEHPDTLKPPPGESDVQTESPVQSDSGSGQSSEET